MTVDNKNFISNNINQNLRLTNALNYYCMLINNNNFRVHL